VTVELVSILRDLWRLRRAVVVAAVLAALVALSTLYKLPSMRPRTLAMGAASTQILVESPRSSLAAINQDMTPLVLRAAVYARFMTSEPVQTAIGRHAGVPGTRIAVQAPVDPTGPEGATQPPAERRSADLVAEGRQFRLFIQNELSLPILDVYSQAPDAATATRLADAAGAGLRDAIAQIEDTQGVAPKDRIRIVQLGHAQGGPVYQGGSKILALLAFIVVLAVQCLALLFLRRIAYEWRIAQHEDQFVGPIDPDLA
jgi:hypothetical protein